MNPAYGSTAAWPTAQQAALGQQQWYAQSSAVGIQPAYHHAYQQVVYTAEAPPLPDEPPPPLPEEPPPVVPQSGQPKAQERQQGLGTHYNNPQSYGQQSESYAGSVYGHSVQHQALEQWDQSSYQAQYRQQQGWQDPTACAHHPQPMFHHHHHQQQQQWGYGAGTLTPTQQAAVSGQQWGSQHHTQQAYMQGHLQQSQFPQQQQLHCQQQQPLQELTYYQQQQSTGGLHNPQQQPHQQHTCQIPSRPGEGPMSSLVLQQQQQQQRDAVFRLPRPPPPPLMGLVASAAVEVGGLLSAAPPQQPALPSPGAAGQPAGHTPAAAPALPCTPNVVELKQVLLPPGRYQRPKRLLLILRGLPGSGKSHVAKVIRQLEVTHGGTAPRIHSIDDYFMVDVEREVAGDAPGALSRSAGIKRRLVVEHQYQHDTAMEASYWRSLMRALGKTLHGGGHSLVLLDAPTPLADQVKEAWLLGERAGYEVLVIDPLTTDPQECYMQNVHDRSLSDIQAMASLFEQPPVMYTRASAKSLFTQQASRSVIDDVDMLVDEGTAEPQPPQQQQTPGMTALHKSRWHTDDTGKAEQEQQHGAGHSPPTARHGGSNGAPAPDAEDQGGGDGSSSSSRPSKKPKLSMHLDGSDAGLDIDHEALLAGVNQALEQLDAHDAAAAGRSVADGKADVVDSVYLGTASRRSTAAASAAVHSIGAGGSHSSSSGGGSKRGILRVMSTPDTVKKQVTWPDQLSEEKDQQQSGFRIAPPRQQLEEVHWLDGLGPPRSLWDVGLAACLDDDDGDDAPKQQQAQASRARGTGRSASAASAAAGTGVIRHSNFAAQVRAEHKSEHDLFRAILLGQNTSTQP